MRRDHRSNEALIWRTKPVRSRSCRTSGCSKRCWLSTRVSTTARNTSSTRRRSKPAARRSHPVPSTSGTPASSEPIGIAAQATTTPRSRLSASQWTTPSGRRGCSNHRISLPPGRPNQPRGSDSSNGWRHDGGKPWVRTDAGDTSTRGGEFRSAAASLGPFLRYTGLPSRSALVAPPLRLAALRWPVWRGASSVGFGHLRASRRPSGRLWRTSPGSHSRGSPTRHCANRNSSVGGTMPCTARPPVRDVSCSAEPVILGPRGAPQPGTPTTSVLGPAAAADSVADAVPAADAAKEQKSVACSCRLI
jgi:hypothetical protein